MAEHDFQNIDERFQVEFDENGFPVDFPKEKRFETGLVETIRLPAYEGAYEVDPDFDGTILLTSGKRMEGDVTVNPIEVQRVSNPQGGRTVYIGGITNG